MTTNIITATVTAYCACTNICCPPTSKGLTANGQRPIPNYTIAGSRKYPFGTKVIFQGRIYTVQDRLAVRFDKRFDIFHSSHEAAKQFGIKTNQTITIITK